MSRTFITQREQQTLLLEGRSFSREQILEQSARCVEDTGWRNDLFCFLKEWFNEQPTVTVQTSGSTGVPEVIEVEKARMIQSACLTCSYFGLRHGDNTLLGLPLQCIGAKMLVVRCLVAGLNLHCVSPSTHPLRDLDTDFVFVPLTPPQVWGCLEIPEEEVRLRKIRHLLLGGMAVTVELQRRLADFPHGVWSGYGMTETLSHIALRRINGADTTDCYTPFAGIELALSEAGTLRIKAPVLCPDVLTTTDMAEILPNGSFRILGRADNVINSGGLKIQIEAVEDALGPYLSDNFQLTALPDTNLGERLVLLVEKACFNWEYKCSHLPKYNQPKQIVMVPKLPLTDSGKPDRCRARILAREFS